MGKTSEVPATIEEITETVPAVMPEEASNGVPQQYQGASMLTVDEHATEVLTEAIDESHVDIRPDGLLYLPQAFYREKLNDAFGIGQWALVQHNLVEQDGHVFYDGSLYVRGHFVSRGMGEARYIKSNPKTSWASAIESAKSDCIVRCCKDLGIGKEMWQPRFAHEWIKKNAVKVWRKKTKDSKGKVGCYQWRHKKAPKFWDERGEEEEESPPVDPAEGTEHEGQYVPDFGYDPNDPPLFARPDLADYEAKDYTGNRKKLHAFILARAKAKNMTYADTVKEVMRKDWDDWNDEIPKDLDARCVTTKWVDERVKKLKL